jgi:formylglycine-generating enzyme required for sulfatase activity
MCDRLSMPAAVLIAITACARPPSAPSPRVERAPLSELIAIPGAAFPMGDARYAAQRPDETPRTVTVAPFSIMRFEVTNAQFAEFARATGHVTDPEKNGWGWVWGRTWRKVPGASWRHPRGSRTGIEGRADHPVVQVSVADAAAYCAWRGMRLPTEAEWELAARGTDGRRYPWGDSHPEQSGDPRRRRANFGRVDCCAPDPSDGYETTAPVGAFAAGASPFGVQDMAGNVWEWTADSFPGQPGTAALRGGGWGNNPYCLRTTYRHANSRNVGRDHIGIRCVRSDSVERG